MLGVRLISIHALREEGDSARSCSPATCRISIHALREEGDDYRLVRLAKFDEFLSTPSARRATAPPSLLLSASRIFLSTPSARRATQGCWRSAVE